VICTSITIFRVFGAESKKKKGRDTMSDKGESPNWLLCRKCAVRVGRKYTPRCLNFSTHSSVQGLYILILIV